MPSPTAGQTAGYWDFDARNAHVEIGSTWLSHSS